MSTTASRVPLGLRITTPSITDVGAFPPGAPRVFHLDEWADSLHPVFHQFSLGRPFGRLPVAVGQDQEAQLPFGLRQAVPHPAVPVGDLSAVSYDQDAQMGVARTASGLLPLARHSTGQTHTTTNPDGHGGPDSDTDYTED